MSSGDEPAPATTAAVVPMSGDQLPSHSGRSTQRPTYPHWNLETLGIRQEAQGRRIGNRLMAPGLARADHVGLPCYLTTARHENLEFYERFGFAVTADALPLVPAGPTHWGMRRPPTTTSRSSRPILTHATQPIDQIVTTPRRAGSPRTEVKS
jgi:hypothetical protein